MSIQNRKIKMFRTYRDPQIPPKSRLAFMMGSGTDQLNGEAELTSIGIHLKVKVPAGTREFLIPLANLENIEFLPEEANEETIKRRPKAVI